MRRSSALIIPIAILVLAAPLAAKSTAQLNAKAGTGAKTSAAQASAPKASVSKASAPKASAPKPSTTKPSASKNKFAGKKPGLAHKTVDEQTKER